MKKTCPHHKADWSRGRKLWDQGLWSGDVRTKANWDSVDGIGYCASVRLAVDIEPDLLGSAAIWGTGVWGTSAWEVPISNEIVLQVNAFDVVMEKGAIV